MTGPWLGKGKEIVVDGIVVREGTGEYHRRHVADSTFDELHPEGYLKQWMGWKTFNTIVDETADRDKDTHDLFLALFFTGCRAGELLTIKRSNFVLNTLEEDPRFFSAYGVRVFKHFKHNLFEETHKSAFRKKFDITTSEPRCNEFIEFLKEKGEDDCEKLLFSFSYPTLYRKIVLFIKTLKLFPHLIRAHRASELVSVHNFSVFQLMLWFGWLTPETPMDYVKLSSKDILKAFGIDPDSVKEVQPKDNIYHPPGTLPLMSVNEMIPDLVSDVEEKKEEVMPVVTRARKDMKRPTRKKIVKEEGRVEVNNLLKNKIQKTTEIVEELDPRKRLLNWVRKNKVDK